MSVLNESVAYFAKARREAVACMDLRSGMRMTYGSLADRAARMGAAIARIGAPRGARGLRVAVLARNSIDFLCLVVACRGIGATLVPFNWRLSPAELAVLAELSEPQVVLFEEEFA